MKKLTLAIFLALVACVAVAQGPGGPGGKGGRPGAQRGGGMRMDPKKRLDEMTKNYHLTPVQVKKVQGLMAAQRADFDKVMKGGGKPDRAAFGKIMEKWNTGLKGVMTKDQYAKFEKDRKDRMGKGRGGGQGHPSRPSGPGGPPRGGGH